MFGFGSHRAGGDAAIERRQHHAMALSEDGQLAVARAKIEQSRLVAIDGLGDRAASSPAEFFR
jgi:hypothetical protein